MSMDAFDGLPASEPVRVVRELWSRIGRGDFPAVLDLLHERVVWTIPDMPGVPFAGTWCGREQVERFFAVVAAVQEPVHFAPCAVVASGEKVVVLGSFDNLVKSTGRHARSRWAQVWSVADGRIRSMVELVDTNAVVEAFRAGDAAPQEAGAR